MTVDTHAFREGFLADACEGFVLLVDNHRMPPPAPPPYLTRKYDDYHLCMFIFHSAAAAEAERKIFPSVPNITIQPVARGEIKTFAMTGYSGISLKVFLRDEQGAFALL